MQADKSNSSIGENDPGDVITVTRLVVHGQPKTLFAEYFKTAAVLIRESGW